MHSTPTLKTLIMKKYFRETSFYFDVQMRSIMNVNYYLFIISIYDSVNDYIFTF